MTAVGAAGVAVIDHAFPGQETEAIKARETALRWMMRGLSAQLAYAASRWKRWVQENRRPDRTT